MAAIARSQHLCQGFGNLTQRGTQMEYIEFLKGAPLKDNDNIFEGIDTTWNRIKGGKAIGDILYTVENDFNFKNPSVHIPQLVEAYQLLQNVEDEHWKIQKSKELIHIIEMCAGLYLEASAETNWATPNEAVKVNIEVLNRSETPIRLIGFETSENLNVSKNIDLKNNIKYNFEEVLNIKENQQPTTPYWLNQKGSLGMYHVENKDLIGLPETPRAYRVTFNLLINNVPVSISKDVVERYAEPDKGELYRPFEIIPEASASIAEKVIIFNSNEKRDVQVIVKAGHDHLKGTVEVSHPEGWQVFPKSQSVSIAHKGEDQSFTFTITPPKNGNEGHISPVVYVGKQAYNKELIEMDYSHIPKQTVLLPNETKVVRLDIQKKGNHIAYIKGAGDVVPESLEQIGYEVQFLTPAEISAESLRHFDAVVVGIRAYNTLDDLQFKQQTLFDFVAQGGNMIVQYNTSHRLKTNNLAPYKLSLSRDRVTDENAAVRFLKPKHPVLNYPNKITQKDFEGWTQERGLYFPNDWGKEFTPILEIHDKKESDKKGSLLIAKYGKGYYIYTGLSFFREFPAGVSGAYRLFANMLSLGKEELNQTEK